MENKKKEKEIPLRTNLPETIISDTLRSWHSQNYSDLVNKPQKKKHFSFKPSNLLHKKNHKHPAIEEKIDFSKLYSNTLSIIPEKNISTDKDKKTLKYLIEEDYGNYVKLIRKIYPNFKFNHYSKYFEQIKHIKCQTENDDGYRRFLFSIIDKDFLLDKDKYVINKELLEENKVELEKKIKELMNKVGEIELRVNHILENDSKIENYIDDNMYIKDTINDFLTKVLGKKKQKELFKEKILKLSSQLILIQQKKQNMILVLTDLKKIKQLVFQFNQIKSSKSNFNCKEENEIISKIKSDLNALKQKYKSTKVLTIIEREIRNMNEQSEEKYIDEYVKQSKLIFEECLSSHSQNENEQTNQKIPTEEKEKYNLIINNSNFTIDNKEILLSNLMEGRKSKLINLLDIFCIIITENFDITLIIDKLKIIFKEIIGNQYNIKKDSLQLLSDCLFSILYNHNYIIELLQNNFAISPKMFNELTKYLITEIKSKITFAVTKIVEKEINKKLELEKLLFIKEEILSQTKNLFSVIQLNQNDFFSQYENDFLFQFFETSSSNIQIEVENEDWIQKTGFSSIYQKKILIVLQDFHNQQESNFILKEEDKQAQEQNLDVITISNNNFKQIKASLTLINFIYETYKILFFIKNARHNQTIILQLCKVIELFISKCKNEIVDGNGKIRKDQRPITEKEFLLLNSVSSCIEKIIFNFNISFLCENDEIITNQLNKTLKKLNEVHKSCSTTIVQLIQNLCEDTLKDFNELDFANYRIFTEKDYNTYVKKFSKLKKIYDNMINTFDNTDISDIYTQILTNFINDFYNVVAKKGRIEPDNMLRQFRNELIYMKKVIKLFDLVDTEKIREKIETISKMVNPNKISKKKKEKNKEKEIQEEQKEGEK